MLAQVAVIDATNKYKRFENTRSCRCNQQEQTIENTRRTELEQYCICQFDHCVNDMQFAFVDLDAATTAINKHGYVAQ